MKQTFGIVSTTAKRDRCQPYKTVQFQFVQECVSEAQEELNFLETPGFSDFYKGRVAVSWTIMTKSKLEPIVLIFEDFYLPCDLGHLVITEGLDESQEICGTDDKWPAIIGKSTNMKLSIQTSRSTMEWKMKLGFRKDVLGACGKLVKNYPRSINPCIQDEAPTKPIRTKGKIPFKNPFGKKIPKKVPKKDEPELEEEEVEGTKSAEEDPKIPKNSNPKPTRKTTTRSTTKEQNIVQGYDPIHEIGAEELLKFQNDLDTRYWNLDSRNHREEKADMSWALWIVLLLIVTGIVSIISFYRRKLKNLHVLQEEMELPETSSSRKLRR
ncbi:Oidioi.mRNA.OKI2018_I69.PAR.g10201.t1.cds [Oikopleura dioica]|uniref:Oidioi.mRNA.OKI2018_I69.PAR.g10201.t1.cds n=1 Tax=Oikopleura dioica TaxID=34765 RepID=A0ABN7RPE4_OIKDI|nr:Oidioi.mRNA.OKI2018_I69.PAR.g10201.t1.cds [Oikopleura dioica]